MSSKALTKGQRLDGTLASVVKEINRLHGEVMTAARTTLEKAIRIGELLTRVRASRKGKWLVWIEDHVSFSHDTARNYIGVYERRSDPELRTVRNLREAYAMLNAPKTGSGSPTGSKPIKRRAVKAASNLTKAPPMPRSELASLPKPIRNIQPEKLETEAEQGEIEIDAEFTARIGQISRKDHAAWPDFPARLIEHGKALIEQGERLGDLTT